MGEKIEAETDGVRVRKSVESNDPGTVIIGFRISSRRDDPAAIQLRDPIPQGHEIQAQSGNDGEWTVTEAAATYDCVLRPDETATTGYKSTAFEDQALETYSTPPSLDVTDPPTDHVGTDEPSAAETETFTRGASDAVFTFHGPDSDTPEQPTPAGNTDEETPTSNPSAADPTEPEEMADSSPAESDGPTAHDEAPDAADEFDAPGDEMGVTELLTDPSASADADPDQSQGAEPPEADEGKASSNDAPTAAEQSPEAVGSDVEIASPADVQARIQRVDGAFLNEQPDRSSPSLDARVQYLQSRFHELAAYIDAMEEFIDEHGDGEHVLTALSTDMERVQERLDRFDDQQTAVQTNLEAIDDRVDTLNEREEAIEDEVYALAESLERMEAVQQSLKEDVEALKAFHEKLQNAI